MVLDDDRIREKPPNGNRIAWRYLSLEKFLDLILNSQIFFTNLTKLTDQYEGTQYDTNLRLALDYAKRENNYFENKNEILNERNEIHNLRNYTLVNCWSLKRHESYALWKIYVGNNPGVAIKTTVSNIRKSINYAKQEFDENISIAEVKYQDKLDDSFSRIEATITKKRFYDFEDEMRLIIFNFPLNENGYKVPYDIRVGRKVNIINDVLISQLYISPFVKHVYRKAIISTIIKLAPYLKNRIHESEINDE